MNEKEQVDVGLKPMFEKAEKEGLFFFSTYQHLWFSPTELKTAQAKGSFNWGACNWLLRNPNEKTDELKARIISIQKELEEWQKKIKKSS